MVHPYKPSEIEAQWQTAWEESGLHRAIPTEDKPKYYCLDYFPYPSGEGLHVGHCRNYIPSDVMARYKRMQGYNVLHPMGWDSFGEPTEQHAIQYGVHPRVSTDQNTANFKHQMRLIGTSYDWEREIDSSLPEFYRWTQWFFLLLYQRGLAYRDTNWQWWCPECQTTLSSSEAEGGVCWRGHMGVYKKEIPAWYFKITAYADELLSGLEEIDWPEKIKIMQRNWIGRSEGWEIDFHTQDGDVIPVFTTRPDTLYGVTFFILAPEHQIVDTLTTANQREQVNSYIETAIRQSDIERTSETREKTGVSAGGFVINPLSGERIPVWIADYVLPTYGTGAVMGVPGHDQRDFEFAKKYGLPVKAVISPDGSALAESEISAAYIDPGMMINSGPYDGLKNEEAVERITSDLIDMEKGRRKVQYRLRDWLISRQRYWGTPIPIVYCDHCGEVAVPEEDLPVLLPSMQDFEPDGTGRSPLARVADFVETKCPSCEGRARRETDTLGGFACSSWYYLRFASPDFHDGPFRDQDVHYWMPVDLYVGGAEHAVLHLLYARFWMKVLADAGLVPFREPFKRLVNQGIMHGPDGQRMSKSRGNVVTPDETVAEFGADSLRIYALFMAPFDQDVTWSRDGIVGARRFLNKVWSLVNETYEQSASATDTDRHLERELHRTIRDVTQRIDGLRFNTMVSAMMEFVNLLVERQREGNFYSQSFHRSLDIMLTVLAPAAPYIAEELWRRTGHQGSVHQRTWPSWQADLIVDTVIELPIQVNGKVRAVVAVPVGVDQEEVEVLGKSQPQVKKYLQGQLIDRIVYVPGNVMNFVTKSVE
jgi:leucyl-tRNA synthetase